MRKIQILLVLALLPSLIPRFAHPIPILPLSDFDVYYTASTLAREHRGVAIYSGADTGVDPQLRAADPGTVFAQRALQLGIHDIQLYVYPPVLADALIPFSMMPLGLAVKAWIAVSVAAVVLIALLLARLMPVALASVGGGALLAALAVSQPVVSGISWGQITVLLLLLWVWGIWLYRRRSIGASAAVFALATAIKLTPLIVIVPFFIWREWKWLRWYAAALVGIVAAMALVNSPAALTDYVRHVIPSMSRGIAHTGNETIPASIQLLYVASTGKTIDPMRIGRVPAAVLTVGKLVSLIAIGISVVLVLRAGAGMSRWNRILTLALFAMLSAAVAPVSWRHAYAVGLPALALLWAKALGEGRLNGRVWLLAFSTVAITSYLNQWAILFLIQWNWQLAAALIALLLPFSAVLLVLLELGRMRVEIGPAGRDGTAEAV